MTDDMTIKDLAEWARRADAIVQVQHHRKWFVDVGPVGYVHEENVRVEDEDLLTALRLAMHEYDARRIRAAAQKMREACLPKMREACLPIQVPQDLEVTDVCLQGLYQHGGRLFSFRPDGVDELDGDGGVVGPATPEEIEAIKTAIKEKFRARR